MEAFSEKLEELDNRNASNIKHEYPEVYEFFKENIQALKHRKTLDKIGLYWKARLEGHARKDQA